MEFFRVASDKTGEETPLDLARLRRETVDFAVADAEALPVASGAFDVVVLRAGDGEGPFADPAAARLEAERAVAEGGVLLVERAPGADPAGPASFEVVPVPRLGVGAR